ncbi:flagellar basal body P-ring formation chaperone FlgA [Selenomonas sp.]|uniref:flagellar basal body P-ring formation chaperone FlgA n=1 Tax=Selenomonas sp. TaxID=2053611 RepID=UPI0025EBB4FB|nr:flagellar basal body P-ring formation chaperone FlgA [Selenomonas sp.]MBQ1868119.1 flagellar basal body P-ring formation protein FlgA [Selenomonas sp.]
MKKISLAILCFLWSGFFCLFIPAVPTALAASAYPQTISSERFVELAQQKVESQLREMGEKRRHELMLIRAPQPMKLPPGPIICEVELPQAVKYSGNVPVHIRVFVNGKFYRRTVCYYEVAVYDKILVAEHDLMLEKPIQPADVRLEERRVESGNGRYLTKMGDLAGRVPARIIRAGSAVESAMLQNPVVFNVGAPLTIIANFNGVEVKTDGLAMQRGRVGGEVRVRNVRSGKVLRGRVIDAKTVEIIS